MAGTPVHVFFQWRESLANSERRNAVTHLAFRAVLLSWHTQTDAVPEQQAIVGDLDETGLSTECVARGPICLRAETD